MMIRRSRSLLLRLRTCHAVPYSLFLHLSFFFFFSAF